MRWKSVLKKYQNIYNIIVGMPLVLLSFIRNDSCWKSCAKYIEIDDDNKNIVDNNDDDDDDDGQQKKMKQMQYVYICEHFHHHSWVDDDPKSKGRRL